MYGYSLETLSCSCILHNVEISIGLTFPPLKMHLYHNRSFLCFPDMLEGGSSKEGFDTYLKLLILVSTRAKVTS